MAVRVVVESFHESATVVCSSFSSTTVFTLASNCGSWTRPRSLSHGGVSSAALRTPANKRHHDASLPAIARRLESDGIAILLLDEIEYRFHLWIALCRKQQPVLAAPLELPAVNQLLPIRGLADFHRVLTYFAEIGAHRRHRLVQLPAFR